MDYIPRQMSWWCSLSRDELKQAIQAREEEWQRQRTSYRDHVVARFIRDDFPPQSNPRLEPEE